MASPAEGADFHGAEVHGHDAAAHALRIEDGGEKLPALVLAHLALGLVAANLLVERVEELLASGCSGKRGAVVESSTETAKIQQSFRGAVEGHAHAIEQVDDGGGRFAHGLDWGLVGEEVAAVDGVVKVLPGGVAFAFKVFGGVDAALRADAMRTLDRDDGKQVHRAAGLGNFDDRRKSRQSSANHNDSGACRHGGIDFLSFLSVSASPGSQ